MNYPKSFRPASRDHHTYYTKYKTKDPFGHDIIAEFHTESYNEWRDFLERHKNDVIPLPAGSLSPEVQNRVNVEVERSGVPPPAGQVAGTGIGGVGSSGVGSSGVGSSGPKLGNW